MSNTISRAVALASVYLGLAGTSYAASSNFKEFTLVTVETSTSEAPNTIGRYKLEAHRADGSQVVGELPSPESDGPQRRFVSLVPERVQVEIHDDLHAKRTVYETKGPPPLAPATDAQCGLSRLGLAISPTYAGEAEVLGFRTIAIHTTETLDGSESYFRTEWRALELDCVTIQLTEERRDGSGNLTGHFEVKPVRIAVGPPAATLFDVPSDSVEKSPSQMHDAIVGQFELATPMLESIRKRLAREDAAYFANHQAAGVK
jgi:hypothetical protein